MELTACSDAFWIDIGNFATGQSTAMIETMAENSMMPHRHRFVKAVANALRQRCGLCTQFDHRGQAPIRLLVATSGGADSVALLRALDALTRCRHWPLDLAVGHVQHHLRNDAQADADFVAQLAAQLELPSFQVDLDLSKGVGNLESRARQARYQALASMAQQLDASFIATAHHSDDQLETLLMRLLRGSAPRGLTGIAWRRPLPYNLPQTTPDQVFDLTGQPMLIRPMLSVDRAGVHRFLNDIGQPWREDHTNTDQSRLRARLRHRVIPELRDIRADVSAKAVSIANHQRKTAKLIDQAIDDAYRGVLLTPPPEPPESSAPPKPPIIDRAKARLLPTIVLGGLLRRVLTTQLGVGADKLGNRALSPIVRAIRDQTGGSRQFALSQAVTVIVERRTVCVQKSRSHPNNNTIHDAHSTLGASPHSISRS